MTQTQTNSSIPIDVGSRLELFVDDYLIAQLSSGAELRLHRPVPQEVALVTDAPWEGNACGYVTVFQDEDRYRMYYRGWHFVMTGGALETPHKEVVCVELLSDQVDTPIEGFSLDDCVEVLGDDLERVVRWSGGPDLSRLTGVPVRLRFVLRDADLYSFRFRPG